MSSTENLVPLMKDREIADLVGMSETWVRNERSKRRQGKHHTLTVDPVYVRDSPRYRHSDIVNWYKENFDNETKKGSKIE